MLLQGNTYRLPVKVRDRAGNIVTPAEITKAQFIFGEFEKFYTEGGEVEFDRATQCFLVPFSEDETFKFRGNTNWQVRLVFRDGSIDGSAPQYEDVKGSITKTRIGGV
jgi:hypothetical protein